MLSSENGSVKELARIETESFLVKEAAFNAAYAVVVDTETVGVTTSKHCSITSGTV